MKSTHKNATLKDVVIVVREDEADHRDVNHYLADKLTLGHKILTNIEAMSGKSNLETAKNIK